MIEIFEQQKKENKIVNDELLSLMTKKNYHNGEPIEIGDNILFALLQTSNNNKEVSYDLITIKEDHLNLYYVVEGSNPIPVLKLK
jgi:predicted neuraminidase